MIACIIEQSPQFFQVCEHLWNSATGGGASNRMSEGEVMHNSNGISSIFQTETQFNRMPSKTNILIKNILLHMQLISGFSVKILLLRWQLLPKQDF